MTTTTREALKLGEAAFRLDCASVERDVRLHELTDDEVSSLVHAVVTAAALATPTVLDPATIEHCARIIENWDDLLLDVHHCDQTREIAAAIRASVEKQ